MNTNIATEAELQAWLDEQDALAKAEAERRKQAVRAALKAVDFAERAKRELKLREYAADVEAAFNSAFNP